MSKPISTKHHSTKSQRPEKPSPDFPLFPHATGRWAKKIKGKLSYFGPWDDPDAALARYLAENDGHEADAPVEKPVAVANGRPKKPYPSYPLYAHANGQWAKTIRGREHYFGPWADHHAALENYLYQKADLEAGRKPKPRQAGALTVQQMVWGFLQDRKLKVEAGEMEATSWKDYERHGNRMIKVFGADTPVESLGPNDFLKYRATLQKTHKSLESLRGDLTRAKTFFYWAGPGPTSMNYLEKLPQFGPAMKAPSRKALDRQRKEQGQRMIGAKPLRTILRAAEEKHGAGEKLKAMILLGINCGFGNTDCAKLTRLVVDLEKGWIDFPRPKTGVERRCPLWPETVAALRAVLKARKTPHDSAHKDIVFLTKYGQPFRPCAIGYEFEKLCDKAGVSRSEADFYDLRRTCISIGLQVNDRDAMRTISGHQQRADDMLGVYNQLAVSDERLRAVADHTRHWLYPGPASRIAGPDEGERVAQQARVG